MSSPIVLVTGASGLLGSWLLRTAPGDRTVVAVVRRQSTRSGQEVRVDLRDRAATADVVAAVRPALVIHAAYAKDEGSIVDATANVAAAASEVGAGLVHVSTDAVFRGDGIPRPERADPDPVSDYGRWKSEAERIVRDQDPRTAIVRLPLIISREPPDHIAAAILDGVTSGRPTTWYTDEVRQPAMADDLAAAIWRIAALDPEHRSGTWHLPGPERLTRDEISRRIVAALDLPPEAIVAAASPPDDPRARDLHLLDDRARSVIGWSPRPIVS